MRCLVLTLLAAVVLLSAASALADITPPVTVRLASPFVAVAPGASYEGEVQITCDAAGTLADFELSSDGWQAALKDAPTTRAVSAGDRILVAFAATAVNPGQKLVLTFTAACAA